MIAPASEIAAAALPCADQPQFAVRRHREVHARGTRRGAPATARNRAGTPGVPRAIRTASSWTSSRVSGEIVRNEAARVAGDRARIFAQADAGGLVADDPGADRRRSRRRSAGSAHRPGRSGPPRRIRRPRRSSARPGGSRRWRLRATAAAFPRSRRRCGPASKYAASRFGMVGEELPQDRQQPLVGQQHLPRRLDHAQARRSRCGPKVLRRQPLPRIELAQHADLLVFVVDEHAGRGIPADRPRWR